MPQPANFSPGFGFDAQPDISGSNVVFSRCDATTGGCSIQKYSITSGTTSEVAPLTSGTPLRISPAIGGSTIAWEDDGLPTTGDPREIVVVDATGTVTRLTNDSRPDLHPRVSPDGLMVVWLKCTGLGSPPCDAYAAVESGNVWSTPSLIATTSSIFASLDTNGSIVVYASDSGGSSHVHFRTFSGSPVGPEQTIVMPTGWVGEELPSIAGNFISYGPSAGNPPTEGRAPQLRCDLIERERCPLAEHLRRYVHDVVTLGDPKLPRSRTAGATALSVGPVAHHEALLDLSSLPRACG